MKKKIALLIAYTAVALVAAGLSMLDGKLWALGVAMMILGGGYIAAFAKAKGLMKIEDESE